MADLRKREGARSPWAPQAGGETEALRSGWNWAWEGAAGTLPRHWGSPCLRPFYSSCFWLSLFCFSFCISFSLYVYLMYVYLSLPRSVPHILALHLSLSLFLFHFICLHFSAVVASPPWLPCLRSVSLSLHRLPCPLTVPLGWSLVGWGRKRRAGVAWALCPLPPGRPGFAAFGFRLLYLGLQLPLIFWLQDTRPGLGQPGPRTQGGRARLAGGEGQGAGRCVLWGTCEP